MNERFRKLKYSLVNFRHMALLSSVVFFLIIGTAILLVYQNAGVMRDQINEDFNEQQLVLSHQAAFQIEHHLSDIDAELNSLIQLLSKIPKTDWEEFLSAAVKRETSRGLMDLAITMPGGETLVSQRAGSQTPVSLRDALQDCRWGGDGKIVLGPLQVMEAQPGVPVVTSVVCYPMLPGSAAGGTLVARIDVSRLIGSIASRIRSGRTGYVWAVNEEGVFLNHPEPEFVGKNAFTARKEREPTISFKQINFIMEERMLRGEEGTGTYVSGWHRGIEGDITKLVAFSPVRSPLLAPGQVWSVAVAAPISELAGPVRSIFRRNLATEAALIVGLFVFGTLAAIYQTRTSHALQKQVEETTHDLEEMERIYERMVEQATDLIYVFDLEMRFVILNQQTVDMFVGILRTEEEGLKVPEGMSVSDEEFWKGTKVDELMRENDAEFVRKRIDEVLEKNRGIAFEHSISPPEDQVRLSTKLIPIRDEKRRIHYVLGISRDMTEKREMDQRIYNAEKLASIGILASGVAHEINNPLAIILGFTDLLLERLPEDSQEHEDLKMIEHNANHAKEVVQNLLGFARITEGLEDTVGLKKSIDIVTQIVRNTLMTKKISLANEVPDDLPGVRGDAREFQQVLFNLINNAVAAMTSQNDGEGTITLSAWSDGNWVHVSVKDTGVGISDRIKPRIFDPFFTTKKAGEGTGLGLSLCYGIVKKYGGTMNFTSVSADDVPEGPTGTTFVVSMPKFEDQQS